MEKNKGLFSFRKHPIGDFPDGKKGKKRKGGRLRRSMGFLMAAALIFNTLPASGLAVSASGREAGLCEHHTEHTPDCGYREAQPCTHEHTEECYKTVTECVHTHTDGCYPATGETEESTGEGNATPSDAGNREPLLCTHVCSEESGCITKVLDCHHEHGESCGYQEAQDCGYACEICNGTEPEDTGENTEDTGTDTAKCICETLCTEDSINGDCPVCGADDASLLDCKGKVSEENTENQEDTGICKHHQEHDADCGYIPKSEDGEGSPCTYECRICPIEDLIAALPSKVTEDNAEDVRAQLDEILALCRELDEDEQGQLDLSRCYELQEALDNANAPVQAAEEINISQNEQNILTAEDGGCPGHTFMGTAQVAMIYVESGAHNVTFSNLNITGAAYVGIAPGATMNLTIEGTNTISAAITYAGIYVPKDATLVITDGSTGTLTVSSPADAGIGGAWTAPDDTGGDVDCGTVIINGGTITATGGGSISASAGIGGAGGDDNPGNGGNVTINGGTVTATGGSDSDSDSGGYYGGAGIGGGSNGDSGDGGTLTINGGTVNLIAGTHDSQYPAYGFGRGSSDPNASTGTCELTLADASYLDSGTTLDPKGKYTINGDPTADMIVVPEDLVYNGKAQELDGKIYIDDTKTGTGTYFGQTFTVKASADGWVLQDLGEVVGAGEYTATFKKGDKEISKTFTVAKSGTDLKTEGKVKTYNGSEETTSFSAGDTITVKATPTATGDAPQKAAARLQGGPGTGSMALYVGDALVSSEAADADADGSYTMTVSASDVLTLGGVEPNGDPITLTAKFVGNDNMADGQGTVKVNITAAAKAEQGGTLLGYYGESGLDAALANSGNAGATFTLLADVERTTALTIKVNCILDLNGKTIRSTGATLAGTALGISSGATVTIRGEGTFLSEHGHGLSVGGTATLEGGTFISSGEDCSGIYVQGKLIVTGENVIMRNTGNGNGLSVNSESGATAQLSGGTYEGGAAAVKIYYGTGTLAGLLNQEGASRVAYYQDNTTLVTEGLDGQALTGTVTVKACTHAYQYAHTTGTTTHSQTCLACGNKKTSENCSYVDGKCACGSTLSVTLTGTEKLVYNGSPHTPGVAVTLDGTELTAGTDYTVAYADNVNAGMDTATVTVTGNGSYSFEIKKTFSIEKAEQENFAVVAETKPYEKNGTFTLSTTGGGGDGAVLYRVPENNGVLMVNGNTATIIGVGTVTVTATKAESGNYKVAAATGNITIEKASAPAITYPTAGSITYGQKLSDCTLTGGSTEYGTFAWKDASTVPAVGDTTSYAVIFTASEETKKNYETIINTTQNVPVKVEKAVPAVSITAAVSGSKDDRQAVITVNAAKAGAGIFPTGTVTFIDCTGNAEVEIGTVTLSNGTASYTWEGLSDQEYTIKAVYAGGVNYKEAESRKLTFDAAKQNQQDFALDAIGAKTYGDAAVTLKTTGGSGSGAVRYESSDEDVIRIEDGRAVITGAGTATITAIKAGDDNYNEVSAGRNVTVAKKALTVKADSKTVVRGNPMPALTYRAEGLVNGDTFTTAPSITAGVQNTDTLGKYDIVISGGTLRNSENYRITYVNGTLNIVERFYTVTVTDGTGGGEYAEGDTVTVTENERNGYTFTGWSSEDGVAFADSKAKTTTFTMPAKSVTVKANYTRNSSGGNNGGGSGAGGNSGGNENNGGSGGSDEGQGSSGNNNTNPGNRNTTPQVPVAPSTDTINAGPGNETAPGGPGTETTPANQGTEPVKPGTGNTERPGTAPGSRTNESAQGTKQPFIKGGDGRIGWDVIRAEEEKAVDGSTINVDMNGSTVVPGDIFDSIKGKDITITFDMGNGIFWSVDGKSVTTDKAGDIDFSVQTGVNIVPVDIVNTVTGENYSIQISLVHEGEFGFTAVLSIGLGKENAGYTASLYYYNESTRELELICADTVAEDGTVSLAFTHASDYVIAIDGEQEEESGNATESAQPEKQDGDSTGDIPESPQTEQAWRPWWFIVAGALVIIMGIGVFFVVKKKGEDEDSK